MGDFDDDFGGDFDDDGFMDEDSFEEPLEGGLDGPDDDNSDEVTPNEHYGPDWKDWMIIGPMSEDIAREKPEREKIRRDMLGDDYMESGPE